MNLTDGIDLVADLLPRKARYAVGIGVAIVALCYPSGLSQFVTWYATEKSHELVYQIQHLLPVPSQPVPSGPSAVHMVDRRLDSAAT